MPKKCRLKTAPADPNCAFKGTPGKVSLKVTGTAGTVEFIKAEHRGTAIVGLPASEITFTIVKGESDLDVVYGFSDPQGGSGELTEICDDETLLGFVDANTPAVRYRICAKGK